MTNNSATGGYLLPDDTSVPLVDDALVDFLQGWVVGITGIAGNLMRPRWQAEPPNIPNFGVTWGAIGVVSTRPDTNGVEAFDPTLNEGLGASVVTFNHELECMLSCYGSGAEGLASSFRSGVFVAQNREALFPVGLAVMRVGGQVKASEKLKERWWPRTDVTFSLRQQVVRVYPVYSLESAQGTLYVDQATDPFIVEG